MAPSVNRPYISGVDHIRAFAMLLVFFYHGLQLFGTHLAHGVGFDPAKHWLYPSNPFVAIIEEGHSGVGLFIVLSGFILTLGTVNKSVDYRRFLLARVLRIYPMLIACLVIAVSAAPTNLISVLTSLLPVNVSGGVSGKFVDMIWAVAVEFQCYLIFPFLIAFSNERGSRFLLQFVIIVIAFRWIAILADNANPRDLSYWTVIGRIDQFCIGMIAARLYVSRSLAQLSAWWIVPSTIAAGVILVAFNGFGGWPVVSNWKVLWPTLEGVMWGCFVVTYIAPSQRLPHAIDWLLAKLGAISYSIYLIHFPIIFAVIQTGLYVTPTGNGYLNGLATTLFVALPITVALATLTYVTIERPFLKLRPKYIT